MLVLAALPFASVQMLGPGLAATTLPLCLLAGVLQMCTSQYKGATDSLTLGDTIVLLLVASLTFLTYLVYKVVGTDGIEKHLRQKDWGGHPFKDGQRMSDAGEKDEFFNICPLSFGPAERRCTSCNRFYSTYCYHTGDSERVEGVGACVADYSLARKAMRRTEAPLVGRLLLDEALDFKFNLLNGAITSSCVGCAVHALSWRAYPLISMFLSGMGFMLAEAPVIAPALTKTRYAPMVLSFASLYLVQAALLFALRAAATTQVFLKKFERSFPRPVLKAVEESLFYEKVLPLIEGLAWEADGKLA